MVEFARELSARKTSMIGITERPFSEMALSARKSGGVMTTFSGEEVTFSAIKGSICLLFCLDILSVWLAAGLGYEKEAGEYLDKLGSLPDQLRKLLHDPAMVEYSKCLVSQN